MQSGRKRNLEEEKGGGKEERKDKSFAFNEV